MTVNESTTIASAAPGRTVRLDVDVASIVVRPESAVQALEVEVVDETGSLTLVWLGRYDIPGVLPGRRLTIEGRVVRNGDQRLMYNPRFELHPRGTDE